MAVAACIGYGPEIQESGCCRDCELNRGILPWLLIAHDSIDCDTTLLVSKCELIFAPGVGRFRGSTPPSSTCLSYMPGEDGSWPYLPY